MNSYCTRIAELMQPRQISVMAMFKYKNIVQKQRELALLDEMGMETANED